MADNDLLQFHKQHSIGQERYTYFLLAVTASAVAFAVQKTGGLKITYSLIPLGAAIFLWGISFYCGVKNINWVQASTAANYSLLQLEKGVHSDQPDDPTVFEAAKRGIASALQSNIKKAEFHGKLQFRLLIAGAVLFLSWHILEMVLRTFPR